jgi:hypothetical protein
VVYATRQRELAVLLAKDAAPDGPGAIRYEGTVLSPIVATRAWTVTPFELARSRVLEVRVNGRWHALPIEIEGEELVVEPAVRELTTDELLARALDPDHALRRDEVEGAGEPPPATRPPPPPPSSKKAFAPVLASLDDVAPRLKALVQLPMALERSLREVATGRAARARLEGVFEPVAERLAAEALAEEGHEVSASVAFVLCDVLRVLDRVVADSGPGDRRAALRESSVRLALLLARVRKARPDALAPVLAAFRGTA